MKFRTIRRIIYLKKARHRRGHGIHSPFLFHLITEVVENRTRLPEYEIFKSLKNNVLDLLGGFSGPSLSNIYHQFNIPFSNPHRLYRKVELPLQYSKVVFRLLREFKPSSVIYYGPSLGASLAIIAMANSDNHIYQLINDAACELVSRELLKDSAISNVHFFQENEVPSVDHEFVIINYPGNPVVSQNMAQKCLHVHGDDDVLIIRGIHESKEMEVIWRELIASESVRVSLDLFEIGITLFRKGLQKESFIQRF
ncbi:MAG TPA: hypothetical protein VFC67_09735 [Prolixibacteraceae bacterium]|nr:hypothetical protein [Prolixibacteraceae bacterium]